VNPMATVQASSHFDVVYGPKYADALRDILPGTLIMYAAHDRHLLEQASTGSGWPNAAASPTTPAQGAGHSPPSSAPPLNGKTSCRRTERKPNCYAAALPANESTSQTEATSCPAAIELYSNAFTDNLPVRDCVRQGLPQPTVIGASY
jgi:hypothetical protein